MSRKLKIFLADLIHDYLPGGNYVVPLNIGYMTAYLRSQFGSELDIRMFKHPSQLLAALNEHPAPDVVAFSNYRWNQELNGFMVKQIAASSPETVICAGGPHIRTEDEGVRDYLTAHEFIDYYCMFEGEIPLGNIIRYFLSNKPTKSQDCDLALPGVAYLNDGELVYPRLEFKKGTIEDIPSPYLSGVLDDFIGSTEWIPLLETNRGCPFHCTFCVWGISAMDKVRVFPLERVLEEIRFVAKRSPSPRWIFADANFGMYDRDLEIAQEIKHAAENEGKLRTAVLWYAKNSSRRTVEIARTLGPLSDPLAAVQSMDDTVLKNIKRDNIKLTTMTDLLAAFHEDHLKANTDIILGLPGESLESHISSLRKIFDLGFDHIGVRNISLLPGSEMESDKTRAEYEFMTKFRLISGAYGRYAGKPVFEYEESVRASVDISEEEMHSLRVDHFLVFALWNLGIAKPLLRFLQSEHGHNPMDAMRSLTVAARDPAMIEFLRKFNEEARVEWFDTAEDLSQYYSEHFDELLEQGFLKMNFKYLAKILLDKDFARMLLRAISDAVPTPISSELEQFCFDRIYFLDDPVEEKVVSYSDELVSALETVYPDVSFGSGTCHFKMDPSVMAAINYDFEKHGFETDRVRALSVTLEAYRTQFLYDFEFAAEEGKATSGKLAKVSR